MYTIIQAKPQYLGDIYSMILELAQHEGIYDRIGITDFELGELLFCKQPNHFVAMALVNEVLVGFAMYNVTYHNVCVNVTNGLYIENLYVSPAVRQQRIGSALFAHVARVAKNMNASRLEWWVSRSNPEAQRFYEKTGATVLSDWNAYKCDQVCIDQLLMDGV